LRCARGVRTDSERAHSDLRHVRRTRKAKTPAHLLGLQMAQGDGESICGVAGFGEFIHLQKSANHNLHLALVGVAVTGDTGFYFTRRIAVDGNAVLGGRKQDDAANFREAKSGAHVEGGEDGFDGEGIGSEFVEQMAE